jgi:hypothetical protein
MKLMLLDWRVPETRGVRLASRYKSVRRRRTVAGLQWVGNPDGNIATLSRLAGAGRLDIEAADAWHSRCHGPKYRFSRTEVSDDERR